MIKITISTRQRPVNNSSDFGCARPVGRLYVNKQTIGQVIILKCLPITGLDSRRPIGAKAATFEQTPAHELIRPSEPKANQAPAPCNVLEGGA